MVPVGPAAESFAAALAAPGGLAAEGDVPSALDNAPFGERDQLVIGKTVDDGDHFFGAALQTGGWLPTEISKETNTDNVVVHGRVSNGFNADRRICGCVARRSGGVPRMLMEIWPDLNDLDDNGTRRKGAAAAGANFWGVTL